PAAVSKNVARLEARLGALHEGGEMVERFHRPIFNQGLNLMGPIDGYRKCNRRQRLEAFQHHSSRKKP
ncbi:hypothetical protein ACEN8K_45760, partial [Variovorax sp. CT11-76]